MLIHNWLPARDLGRSGMFCLCLESVVHLAYYFQVPLQSSHADTQAFGDVALTLAFHHQPEHLLLQAVQAAE